MKKSVLILIGIIYIAAIVVVGFFGMRFTVFEEIVYIDKLECTNKEAVRQPDGSLQILYQYYEGEESADVTKQNKIIIGYKTYPDNSTISGSKAVTLTGDPNSTVAEITDGIVVTFKKPGVYTVTLRTTDGSNLSQKIKIIAWKPFK